MRYYSRCELNNNNFPVNSFEVFYSSGFEFREWFFSMPEYFSRLSSGAWSGRVRCELDKLLIIICAYVRMPGLFSITRGVLCV